MASLLFLPHRMPYPPDKGDKVRSHHLLRCAAGVALTGSAKSLMMKPLPDCSPPRPASPDCRAGVIRWRAARMATSQLDDDAKRRRRSPWCFQTAPLLLQVKVLALHAMLAPAAAAALPDGALT